MKLSELYLDRYLYRDNDQDSETKDSAFVAADSTEGLGAPVTSGGAAQDVNTGNVMIDSANLPSTIINAGDYGWTQSCAFTSADTDTVTWGGGTFIDSAGNSYTIDAGTTGDMVAKTYIYLSLLESETAYQKSTTSADSVGTGKVLIAVAQDETDAATYNLVQAEQIVGDNILVNTIDAGKIKVGTLIVGTNVAIGTAEDEAGVTTIVGNTVTTGYITALSLVVGTEIGLGTAEDAAGVTTIVGNTITTGYVNALSITVLGSVTAGSISVVNGGNTIGLTPAGANAIFAGTTGSPQFRVTPAGALTATSVTITGDVTATAGSDWTGNAIASAYIGNLDAGKITTGSLSVARTDATNGATFNSNISGGGTGTDQVGNNGYVTNISGGTVNTGTLNANNCTITNINASNISTGTLSGRTVQTSSGNDRVKLVSDNIEFYSGGSLRATVDGTSAGSGGVRSTGDWLTANNHAFWIASTGGGASEYGGIAVNGSNHLQLHCGTNNSLYVLNNAGASMYILGTTAFTVGSSSYSPNIIPYSDGGQDIGDGSHRIDDVFCFTAGNQTGNAIWFDQAGRIQVDNHFDPSGTGTKNLGGASRYWGDVSYKTLTDRGCLGWFDDGVELQDGTIVSDIEALQAIQKHPTKKTVYGTPMLDYTTFPKVSYTKAKDHEGNEYERDSKGEPKEIDEYDKKTKKMKKVLPADGVEMTSMFSIFIGAFKELDNRLKTAENEVELLKNQ